MSGSVEAIVDAIGTYEPLDDEPDMIIVNFDIGPVSLADIREAHKSDPKLRVINFNQSVEPKIAEEAKMGYKFSGEFHRVESGSKTAHLIRKFCG